MRIEHVVGCVLALAVLAGPTIAVGAEKFVPQGHTYSPQENRLPPLNTWRDRVNSQADIYEAENYRIERERAIIEGELQRHIQHDFSGGAVFQPRY